MSNSSNSSMSESSSSSYSSSSSSSSLPSSTASTSSSSFQQWRERLPNSLPPAPKKCSPRQRFCRPFFKSSLFKTKPKKRTEIATSSFQGVDDKITCSGIQGNPLYLHSKDNSHSYDHDCRTCPKDLWFLHSHRAELFKWSRGKKSFQAKLEEMASTWQLREYFYAKEIDGCHTKPQFQGFLNILVKQYQENQLRALKQIGLHEFESLRAKPQRFPDGQTKFLAWENNSCSYDAVLCIVPHLLLQMEELGMYGKRGDSDNSRATSTPALHVLGCLHFCSSSPNTSVQVIYSNLLRECVIDLVQWSTGRNVQEDSLWSIEGTQDFLDLGDVISRIFFPLFKSAEKQTGPQTYILPLHALPSEKDLEEDNLADYLLSVTQNKPVPSLGVIYLPKVKTKKARKSISDLLCKKWVSQSDEGVSGHVFGFFGSPLRNSEHFISAICGEHPDLYINDAMRNNGTFQEVNGMKLLKGKQQHSFTLSTANLRIIFLRR